MEQELIKRIRAKEAGIAVIGLGHVGLVTAVMFAKTGFKVVGVDINSEVVETISSGKSHIKEHGLTELIEEVVRNGNLSATPNVQLAFRDSDVGIVCVQTPLTNDNRPDLYYIEKACKDLAASLSTGKLVIIESTVPPSTTNLVAGILEGASKLKCGKDFWLAHCPERISTGNSVRDFTENVRIVGGYDRPSTRIAKELFRTVSNGQILTIDSTTAEVAKLAENSFRDVNIAFANELALICEEIGVDVVDVVKLANTHPRVNIHKAGCGVGGPCITKDSYLLLHPAKKPGFRSKLIVSSREINDYMPIHTVELVVDALKKVGKDTKDSRIAVLGVAYKGEIDDVRNSVAERIVSSLMKLGAEVAVYDPYAAESFGATRAPDLTKAVEGADCIVIVTEHKVFRKLELRKLKATMKEKPVIVDGRRLIDPTKARKLGFLYAGIGYQY